MYIVQSGGSDSSKSTAWLCEGVWQCAGENNGSRGTSERREVSWVTGEVLIWMDYLTVGANTYPGSATSTEAKTETT